MASRVTITTVARRANVSRQTVSNVLNSPEIVRTDTRRRVYAAIEELGYRANLAARQMRTGRSRLIAVRIDPVRNGIDGVVLDRFLHGLTEAAAPAGYRIVLYTATDDDAEIATYEELLASYALDAFVLTHTHHGDSRTAWLRDREVPFTTFGRPWGETERHSWVDVDGAAGTAMATRHLIEAGHSRIGFLGWPRGLASATTAGAAGPRRWPPPVSTPRASSSAPWTDSPRACAPRGSCSPGGDRPTGLVCASDQLALGARQAGEVAVIGFDDTAMAEASGLSTVRQPLAEAAAECVRILADLLGDNQGTGSGDQPRQVLLSPQLVIRESG